MDAGITALIQKALDAKKVMAEPDIAERLQSSMESEFTKLFTPEEPQENKFVSTATFRATKKKAGTLNVAAYIRVSTDMSDQENSYEAQEKYFGSGDYAVWEERVAGSPEYAFNEYLELILTQGPVICIMLIVITLACLWAGTQFRRYGVCGAIIALLIFSFSSYLPLPCTGILLCLLCRLYW